MSQYDIEYCPWCGDDVFVDTRRIGGNYITCNVCRGCETVFRVQAPHSETEIKWRTA